MKRLMLLLLILFGLHVDTFPHNSLKRTKPGDLTTSVHGSDDDSDSDGGRKAARIEEEEEELGDCTICFEKLDPSTEEWRPETKLVHLHGDPTSGYHTYHMRCINTWYHIHRATQRDQFRCSQCANPITAEDIARCKFETYSPAALISAINDEDQDSIKEILKYLDILTCPKENYSSILHFLADTPNIPANILACIFRSIISQHGGNPDFDRVQSFSARMPATPEKYYGTPLHIAAAKNNTNFIEQLLIASGSLNNQRALLSVSLSDDKLLLPITISLLNRFFLTFTQSVHKAALAITRDQNLANNFAKELLTTYCNTRRNGAQTNILHVAALTGYFEGIVRCLQLFLQYSAGTEEEKFIALGEYLKYGDSSGKQAIHIAIEKGTLNNFLLAIKQVGGQQGLMICLGSTDPLGNTPLHTAIKTGDTTTTQMLIRFIFHSLETPSTDKLTTLLTQLQSRDQDDKDCITLAIENRCLEIILNEAQAADILQLITALPNARQIMTYLNTPNQYGDTPLHSAIKAGDTTTIKSILGFVWLSSPEDSNREAILSHHLQVTNGESENSITLATKNNCLDLFLDQAQTVGSLDAVQVCLSIRNHENNTPLLAAIQSDDLTEIELILKALYKSIPVDEDGHPDFDTCVQAFTDQLSIGNENGNAIFFAAYLTSDHGLNSFDHLITAITDIDTELEGEDDNKWRIFKNCLNFRNAAGKTICVLAKEKESEVIIETLMQNIIECTPGTYQNKMATLENYFEPIDSTDDND